MTPRDLTRLAKMEAKLASIERDVRLIPARWPRAKETLFLFMGPGNTIGTYGTTTVLGLKNNSTAISAVPQLTPAVGAPDGLSFGYIGGSGLNTVWCAERIIRAGTSTTIYGVLGSIPENTVCVVTGPYLVPITGAPTTFAPVYLIIKV